MLMVVGFRKSAEGGLFHLKRVAKRTSCQTASPESLYIIQTTFPATGNPSSAFPRARKTGGGIPRRGPIPSSARTWQLASYRRRPPTPPRTQRWETPAMRVVTRAPTNGRCRPYLLFWLPFRRGVRPATTLYLTNHTPGSSPVPSSGPRQGRGPRDGTPYSFPRKKSRLRTGPEGALRRNGYGHRPARHGRSRLPRHAVHPWALTTGETMTSRRPTTGGPIVCSSRCHRRAP
mmetsp:Transcript_14213/g.40385  ORF Transcript_14213/g.40385 Transcript_14213/m.40385 type:complete len:232 (-) Transcript_14213:1203-1898(-)